MPKAIPRQQRKEAVRLHLLNYSNEKIAERLGISYGSVHNIIQKFKEGLDQTEYESLRILNQSFTNLGISAKEALEGSRIFNYLSKMGINQPEFLQLLSDIFKVTEKDGADPKKLLDASAKLINIESSEQIPAEQIPSRYKQLVDESKRIKTQLSHDSRELENLKAQHEEQLEKNRTTQKELDLFAKTRKELQQDGLDTSDYHSLSLAIKNAKENNYNHKKLISKIAREESLEGYQLRQEQTLRETNQKIGSNNATIKGQEQTIRENEDTIKALVKFNSLGIEGDDLEELYSKVVSAGFSSRVEAINYLQEIIKESNVLADIKNKISQEDARLDRLSSTESAKKDEIKKLEAKISSLKKSKVRLESEIESLRNRVGKILDEIVDVVRNEKDQVIQVNNSHNKEITSNHDKALAVLLSTTRETSELMREHFISLADASDEVKALQSTKSIANLIRGEGSPLEIRLLLIAIIEPYYKNFEKYASDDSLRRAAANFLQKLIETKIPAMT